MAQFVNLNGTVTTNDWFNIENEEKKSCAH